MNKAHHHLTGEEQQQYSRQTILPSFGMDGQMRLKKAKVLIFGLGGLGSPAALYLTSSGVGHLTLVDFDVVEASNLPRQIIHPREHVGMSKTQSAKSSLTASNTNVSIEMINYQLEGDELLAQCAAADVVLDCTDNFQSRYEINRACVESHTSLVVGAAVQTSGQLSVFDFSQHSTPCYQCLYPDLGDEEVSCADLGIIAPVVGVIGVMQALEAIKIITDLGESTHGKLLIFDGLNGSFRSLTIGADMHCPVCQKLQKLSSK